MRDDGERWDARYLGRSSGAPSMPKGLAGIELPSEGRCLDVACGLGEQSLWAAQRGFEVIAVDSSATAIAALRVAAAYHGVAGRIDARIVDLDDGLPAETSGDCALVICQRFRDVRLYPDLILALRPGGVLAITVLSHVGAVSAGPFHAPARELTEAFSPLEVLCDEEGGGEATLVARRPNSHRTTV